MYKIQALYTLMRELKISFLLWRYLQSVFTHWYWSLITVTSDSRIRPIVYEICGTHLYLF